MQDFTIKNLFSCGIFIKNSKNHTTILIIYVLLSFETII